MRYVKDLLGMNIDCIRNGNYVCNVSFDNKQNSIKDIITYVNKVGSSAEEDRVFIPLKQLAKLFNIKIFFDSKNKTIYIDDVRLFTNYSTKLKNFYYRDVLKEQAFINEDSVYNRDILINNFISYSKIPCEQNAKECLIFRLSLKNNHNIEVIPETITIDSFDVKGGYIFFGNLYPAPPDHANSDYYESLRAKPCGTQKTKLLLCTGQIPIDDKVEFIILFASN